MTRPAWVAWRRTPTPGFTPVIFVPIFVSGDPAETVLAGQTSVRAPRASNQATARGSNPSRGSARAQPIRAPSSQVTSSPTEHVQVPGRRGGCGQHQHFRSPDRRLPLELPSRKSCHLDRRPRPGPSRSDQARIAPRIRRQPSPRASRLRTRERHPASTSHPGIGAASQASRSARTASGSDSFHAAYSPASRDRSSRRSARAVRLATDSEPAASRMLSISSCGNESVMFSVGTCVIVCGKSAGQLPTRRRTRPSKSLVLNGLSLRCPTNAEPLPTTRRVSYGAGDLPAEARARRRLCRSRCRRECRRRGGWATAKHPAG